MLPFLVFFAILVIDDSLRTFGKNPTVKQRSIETPRGELSSLRCLTIPQVASLLNCSKRHIVNTLDRGALRDVRVGHRRLIRVTELEAFSQKVGVRMTDPIKKAACATPSRVVESYVYCNEAGEPIARVDRLEPGFDGAAKSFLPYLADGRGSFCGKPGLNGAALPLYHLDEVKTAIAGGQAVYCTEGEGKCDRLRDALRENGSKVAATTMAGGANAPLRAEQVAALVGIRTLCFFADSDVQETVRRPSDHEGLRKLIRSAMCASSTCSPIAMTARMWPTGSPRGTQSTNFSRF